MHEDERTLVREAYALRLWAAGVLLRGEVTRAPAARAGAWRLFLTVDACASPLRAALAHARAGVGEDGEEVLAAAALKEAQLALAARGALATLGQLAQHHGWKLVLLKAAVAVAEGETLRFNDIDVLATRETAAALSAALGEQGAAAYSAAIPERTFAGRVSAGGVPVDIQYGLKGMTGIDGMLARAVPLASGPLFRLSPLDHAWHVLVHITEQHPERRGRLRDLWLLRRALVALDGGDIERRASPLQRAVVRHALDGGPDTEWMRCFYARAATHRIHARGLWRNIELRVQQALLPEATVRSIMSAELARWQLLRQEHRTRGSLPALIPRGGVAAYVASVAALTRYRADRWFRGS